GPDASVRVTVPRTKLALLHPADIADIVEEMAADERREVFEQLDVETAAEALSEVEPELQASIVTDLPEERAADILDEMAPDEAADLLQDLPEERREELVELMQKEEAQDVEELLSFPEDTAGGIMTTDFVALAAELTAQQAIDRLRELRPDPELTYYLYVIDGQGRLDGVISLRDLVVAKPEQKVADVMDPRVLNIAAAASRADDAAPADNGAGGITTSSLAGAQFGFGLMWVLLVTAIALTVTQETGARLALATGQGLAGLIRERFGVRWTAFAVLTMLVANLGTTIAEFAGMAAALGLFGVPPQLSALLSAALVVLILARGSFNRIQYAFVAIG